MKCLSFSESVYGLWSKVWYSAKVNRFSVTGIGVRQVSPPALPSVVFESYVAFLVVQQLKFVSDNSVDDCGSVNFRGAVSWLLLR